MFNTFKDESEDEAEPEDQGHEGGATTPRPRKSFEQKESTDVLPEVLQAVEASSSRQLFDTLLTKYYLPLESWYTRTIVDKVGQVTLTDTCSTYADLGSSFIES